VQPDEQLLQTAGGSTVGNVVLQRGRHLGFKAIDLVRGRSLRLDAFRRGHNHPKGGGNGRAAGVELGRLSAV
jgi:hypothetical protein